MKILHVISYGYLAGGAENSVSLLKEHLSRRGHQVKVISSNYNQSSTAKRISDIEFPAINSPGTSLIAKMIKHLWYVPSYQAIKATIAEFRPDIVHFHTMGQLSPSAFFATGQVPSVLTVHGPEQFTTGILEWDLPKHLFKGDRVAPSHLTPLGKGYYLYFRYLQRPIYAHSFHRRLKGLIAPTQYMTELLEKENYGVPIYQINNGIDLPKVRPLKNKRRLLYVGRLEYIKGVDVLLKAMPQVVRQLPDVRLSIVGEGAVRPQLEAYARQYQLQKHITFHGWLNSHAVSNQYAQATAVIVPSICPDNLPTVCIEALAMGRPVIGSDSGGIPEAIDDGITGRIVAKGNADELAAAIIDLLSQPNLSTTVEACAASVQGFKITTLVENLELLYQQMLDNKA